MKSLLLTCCFFMFARLCYSQETVEVNMKLTRDITATYHVLKSDMKTKDGLYQVKHGKNLALASGLYVKDKKVGLWHFFDYKGELVQNFDYDSNELTYEAPDKQSAYGFHYTFDRKLKDTEVGTKPIKVGGRYYGYLPLTTIFRKPANIEFYDGDVLYAHLQLLISPGGRLADYTVQIGDAEGNKAFNINLDLLSDEDKTFIPATIKGEPVSCTISIPCTMNRRGELTIL